MEYRTLWWRMSMQVSRMTGILNAWSWVMVLVIGFAGGGCTHRAEDPSAFLRGFSAKSALKKLGGFVDLGPCGGDGSTTDGTFSFTADVKFDPGAKGRTLVKEFKKELEAEAVGAGARLLHNEGEQSTDDGLWGFHFQYAAGNRSGWVRAWLVKSEQARYGGHYLMITIDER